MPKRIALISTLIVSSLVLAGCATAPAEVEEAVTTPTPTAETTESATPSPTESETEDAEKSTATAKPVIKAQMTDTEVILAALTGPDGEYAAAASYEAVLDKYGSDEEIQAVHHTETVEVRDEYDRLVVPEKIITDKNITQDVIVGPDGGLDYTLSSFPVANTILPLNITITLGDYFQVWDRSSQDAEEYIAPKYFVTNITLKNLRKNIPEDRSTLNIYGRDGTITDIYIPNSLNGFPSTWGGSTTIYGRDDETTIYTYGWISDPINIAGDARLYSIVGQTVEDTNTIIPIFRFKSIGVAPV
jgi:hypothetical protein